MLVALGIPSLIGRFTICGDDIRAICNWYHYDSCEATLTPSAHTDLCRINTFLDNVDVGEYYVHGDLEAYSCRVSFLPDQCKVVISSLDSADCYITFAGKLAGLDRKLCKNLEDEVEHDCSPLALSKSPVGPLAESSR